MVAFNLPLGAAIPEASHSSLDSARRNDDADGQASVRESESTRGVSEHEKPA